MVLLPLLLPFQPVLLVWITTTGWALYCLYSSPFSERHIVGAMVRKWSISHRLTWWELTLFPIPFCVCLLSADWGFVLCVCCCCWGFVLCVCVVCLRQDLIVLAGLKLPPRTRTHRSLPVSASQVWVTTPGGDCKVCLFNYTCLFIECIGWAGTCSDAYVEVGQPIEVSSLLRCGPRYWIQGVSLGSQHFYLLSHPTGPSFCFHYNN